VFFPRLGRRRADAALTAARSALAGLPCRVDAKRGGERLRHQRGQVEGGLRYLLLLAMERDLPPAGYYA
jgi:hypothetical protein